MKIKVPKTIQEFADTKNYLAPNVLYSFGYAISEYDISKANINILRSFGKITESDYLKLLALPKIDREVEIGKRILIDWSIQETIDKGIAAAKLQFLTLNNIDPNTILRIANDAFYLTGNNYIPYTTVIPEGGSTPIQFLFKKKFNFYMKLNSVLFFCNDEGAEWDVDVIGIGNVNLEMHHEFISFLCNVANQYIYCGKQSAIKYVNEFHRQYINNELNIRYYREFNANSSFKYCQGNNDYLSYIPIGGANEKFLDRSYNLNLIRTIYSYLLAS